MMDINKVLTEEFPIKDWQTANALELRSAGGTIPFIARYRKEKTGNLDENVLRDLFDRHDYLTELEERKGVILESIESQGKLTDELRRKIEECQKKTDLEDLYLPYKPKRRTRAVIARENGLEPLAELIKSHNSPDAGPIDIEAEAAKFIGENVP
ncbi:MAG: Tex-like N-terminal domain-containing protein, partial [Candidatus Kapaibacterium sp.]